MSYDTKVAIITGALLVAFVCLLVGSVVRAELRHRRDRKDKDQR